MPGYPPWPHESTVIALGRRARQGIDRDGDSPRNLSNDPLTLAERRDTLFSRLAGGLQGRPRTPRLLPGSGPSAVPLHWTGQGGCDGPGQGCSPVLGGSRRFLFQ